MDLYTASELKSEFQSYYSSGITSFIIDFEELSYIDSTGVGTIISIYTTLRKEQGTLYISGMQGAVKKVIEFTKLTGFLPLVPSLSDAKQRLRIPEKRPTEVQGAAPQHSSDYIGILQDGEHPLFTKKGMYHKDFNLDLKKVRYLAQLIVQKAPKQIREINLLEQQISEIIKNAVRHGNRNDPNKKVKIWFSFSTSYAHLIVEDEGEGFAHIAEWNEFFRKKQEAFERQDFEEMLKYVSYRTGESTEDDGGNALFAAVEFWNEGVVFNDKGNAVAVKRSYENAAGSRGG
jgi:anti-anti-sigma factor